MYNNVHELNMSKISKQQQKPIQLQVALVPVCKMVIRFGLHFNEFTRNIQKAYIKAAQEILIDTKIKPSLQAIAIKTGMDRRTISEHVNNIEKSYSNPLNKMDMLISQLQRHCFNTNNNKFTYIQLKNIIDSIYGRHIRSGAISKELLSNNIIIQLEGKIFKLNLTIQQQLEEIAVMANEVDFTAKRLFQTYYKNMFKSNKDKKNHLLQSSCYSTRISPRHHSRVNQLIKDELNASEKRIRNILEKHESNLPIGTFPEVGASQFQFDSQQ